MGYKYFPLIFSLITFYPNIHRDKNAVNKKGRGANKAEEQTKQGGFFWGFLLFCLVGSSILGLLDECLKGIVVLLVVVVHHDIELLELVE